MKSFLNEIDKYIKENNLQFKAFKISPKYLPKYIDYAITSMIRETKPEVYELAGCETYTICYDEDNNICLKGKAHDYRTVITIYPEYIYSNYNHANVYGRKVSEKDLYTKACTIKMREQLKEKISSIVDGKFPNMTKIDKIKQVFEIMNALNLEDVKMFYDLTDEEIDKELEESINKTIEYISYVNKSYNEDMQAYLNENAIQIKYNKPISDSVVRKSKKESHKVKDRVNAIIPMNERLNILGRYSPVRFGMAYSSDNKKSDYYCALYYDYEERPILVLESSSGTNYTKVVLLDDEIFDSREYFSELCKYYLELSNETSLKTGKVIRFKHSNIEDYNSNIDLVINGEKQNIKYHPSKLERIKKVKEEK